MTPRPPADPLEARLRRAAEVFPYPPTPPISTAVRGRLRRAPAPARLRLASVLMGVLVACSLWALPPVRAAVLEWLQIGAVTVVIITPTRTSPQPTATTVMLTSALQLSGSTTRAEAEGQLGRSLPRLALPADLGEPALISVQVGDRLPMVTQVWTMPGEPDQVRLVLAVVNSRGNVMKYMSESGIPIMVDQGRALWLTEPHQMVLYGRRGPETRFVTQHVLVWEVEGFTYRIETDAGKDEAIRIAESLVLTDS